MYDKKRAFGQGLTLVHCSAQLERFLSHVLGYFADCSDKHGSCSAKMWTFGNTSLTLELNNLSTFGQHTRVHLGYMGDKVSLS